MYIYIILIIIHGIIHRDRSPLQHKLRSSPRIHLQDHCLRAKVEAIDVPTPRGQQSQLPGRARITAVSCGYGDLTYTTGDLFNLW